MCKQINRVRVTVPEKKTIGFNLKKFQKSQKKTNFEFEQMQVEPIGIDFMLNATKKLFKISEIRSFREKISFLKINIFFFCSKLIVSCRKIQQITNV